jgi:hypothetical protein
VTDNSLTYEPVPDLAGHTREWWVETARVDVDGFLPKLMEYGSHDLVVIGAGMMPHASDSTRMEAGIAFYLLGKASRAVGAYQEGRTPSDDTWLDLSVYSMMGRHVRKFGGLR